MNDTLLSRALPKLETRAKPWVQRHRGALLCVALPTVVAAIYYFLIAADLYVSEARFVVRAPGHATAASLAGLLPSIGFGRGGEDVYPVHDYVLSRDAITAVSTRVDLRAVFGRPEADFVARYPNLVDRDSAEDFFQYYKRRVDVVYDTTTGISTLTVKAFRPDDAQAVARVLLDEAEAMINRLNDRVRADTVRQSEAQVAVAERAATDAADRMLAYREREILIDPGKTSSAMFEMLTKTQAELTSARIRMAELDRSSPGSPLRAELQAHIETLENQIKSQRGRLAGGTGSIAPKISDYEQLQLRQEFAAKELTSALASLESAREEARHQQVYLNRVVDASLPDKALYPRRLADVAIVFVTTFLIYSIGLLLLAGVREHAQT